MGFLLWVPYAIIGFFVETYFELEILISIWGVVGYSIFGLLTGFSADFSFKIFKVRTSINEKILAGLTEAIMSLTYFITTIIAIGFFYKVGWAAGSFSDPGTFLGVAYFCLPWILINSFFGGFTVYAIYYLSDHGKSEMN